ncbi:MAG: tetratricopeptide repeat protein [Alphaproteobacteria bacterium]
MAEEGFDGLSSRWEFWIKESRKIFLVGAFVYIILFGSRFLYQEYYSPVQLKIGAKYMLGIGVPKDPAIAAQWFRKAADLGNPDGQNMLGTLYLEGNGVPQDYAEAAKWFRKAAEKGLPEAQNNLGILFGKGTGVPQDYIEAAKWFREAAEHGNPRAQMNLGALYANGHGRIQDWQEAYFWISLSGLDEKEVAYAVKHLTPEQRKTADKRLEN